MVYISLDFFFLFFRPEHKKNTQRFWWEYKADPKLRDKVLITTEDTDRY